MDSDDDYPDDWIVRVYSYSGLGYTYARGSHEEMQLKAAELIERRQKRGCEVVKIHDHKWEVLEPEDSVMVSDEHGYITIRHCTQVSRAVLHGQA